MYMADVVRNLSHNDKITNRINCNHKEYAICI